MVDESNEEQENMEDRNYVSEKSRSDILAKQQEDYTDKYHFK